MSLFPDLSIFSTNFGLPLGSGPLCSDEAHTIELMCYINLGLTF